MISTAARTSSLDASWLPAGGACAESQRLHLLYYRQRSTPHTLLLVCMKDDARNFIFLETLRQRAHFNNSRDTVVIPMTLRRPATCLRDK